ncbi:MAG: hypothetical protein Q9220_001803 [cf. Caloplaca sp. 1 TL-2023]
MSTTKRVTTEDRGDYETDTRWTAIDEYTLANLHPASRPNSTALSHALENSQANGLPDIGCPAVQGKFFALQCRMLNVTHSLELGTLGGYSAIWLLTTNPQMHITTIEYDSHHAKIAQENFEAAGVMDRVELLVGAGLDILPRIRQEVEAGERPRFGFTFIDADKPNNWNYFDFAVGMSKPGACIVVDNVAAKGQLTDAGPAKSSVRVQGAREVVEQVGKDERVDATVLQTVSDKDYDGFLIAMVK